MDIESGWVVNESGWAVNESGWEKMHQDR